MKKLKLMQLIFMALCCDLGLFAKKLIAPAANLLTDAMHIPGGIGTGFSLMFLVVAASLVGRFGCGALMGAVQSALALAMGMAGSMGALAPVGYILPGLAIDLALRAFRKRSDGGVMAASVAASLAACLAANAIVFRLKGLPLLLYGSVACTTGAICGLTASALVARLRPILNHEGKRGGREE